MTMLLMIAAGSGLMLKSLRDDQLEERAQIRAESDDSRQGFDEIRKKLSS
jgi:hypothetical protein